MTREFAEKVASFVSKAKPECKVHALPSVTGTMRWVFASQDTVIEVSHYSQDDSLYISNLLTEQTREITDEKMTIAEIVEAL